MSDEQRLVWAFVLSGIAERDRAYLKSEHFRRHCVALSKSPNQMKRITPYQAKCGLIVLHRGNQSEQAIQTHRKHRCGKSRRLFNPPAQEVMECAL